MNMMLLVHNICPKIYTRKTEENETKAKLYKICFLSFLACKKRIEQIFNWHNGINELQESSLRNDGTRRNQEKDLKMRSQ
jgi:hypothetical protein